MTFEENLAREIENFKNLISRIDYHTDDSKFFYEVSRNAGYIAHDIEHVHSAYYVAFVEHGPDDNFDRCWYPLGYMTAEQAYKILNEELVDEEAEPWNDNGIKEVTEEEFGKYYDLIEIQTLYDDFYPNQNRLKDILPPDFINKLTVKKDTLRNELGLTRQWMRVSSRH